MNRLARILTQALLGLALIGSVVFGFGLLRYKAHLEQTLASGATHALTAVERVPLKKQPEPQLTFSFKTSKGITRQIEGYAVSREFYDGVEATPARELHAATLGDEAQALPLLVEDAPWMIGRATKLLLGPLLMGLFSLLGLIFSLVWARRAKRAVA